MITKFLLLIVEIYIDKTERSNYIEMDINKQKKGNKGKEPATKKKPQRKMETKTVKSSKIRNTEPPAVKLDYSSDEYESSSRKKVPKVVIDSDSDSDDDETSSDSSVEILSDNSDEKGTEEFEMSEHDLSSVEDDEEDDDETDSDDEDKQKLKRKLEKVFDICSDDSSTDEDDKPVYVKRVGFSPEDLSRQKSENGSDDDEESADDSEDSEDSDEETDKKRGKSSSKRKSSFSYHVPIINDCKPGDVLMRLPDEDDEQFLCRKKYYDIIASNPNYSILAHQYSLVISHMELGKMRGELTPEELNSIYLVKTKVLDDAIRKKKEAIIEESKKLEQEQNVDEKE